MCYRKKCSVVFLFNPILHILPTMNIFQMLIHPQNLSDHFVSAVYNDAGKVLILSAHAVDDDGKLGPVEIFTRESGDEFFDNIESVIEAKVLTNCC